jgi:hypothetical protein
MMRRIKHWVASALLFMMIGVISVAMLYLMVMSNFAGYNDYVACNPSSGISRIEWFLGIRPVENECWRR